jgi:hypothetical protein
MSNAIKSLYKRGKIRTAGKAILPYDNLIYIHDHGNVKRPAIFFSYLNGIDHVWYYADARSMRRDLRSITKQIKEFRQQKQPTVTN